MKYNDRTNRYIVYASKNGKKKALLNSCSSGSIVTNGKYLYYESAAFLRSGSFGGTYKNRKLVQYNLKTRKNKVLISFRGRDLRIALSAAMAPIFIWDIRPSMVTDWEILQW